ncbi:MAG: DUF6804 family protein [Candidatus Paceibacterota bacterium]|jgi:hypothetical protein
MNIVKENWFKIIAIILLLWALTDNPYGYYQFLRWIIMVAAGWSLYLAYESKKIVWIWIFGIMAILFNPIYPFYLSKNTWQYIDVISAFLFFISLFLIKNSYIADNIKINK